MDEQVKARLIGATVLVVVAVVLVPELLSGPKHDTASATTAEGKRTSRTVTIDLGGAVANGARLQPGAPVAASPRDASRLPTVEAPGAAAERGEAASGSAADRTAAEAVRPAATVASSERVSPPPAPAAQTGPAKPAPAPVSTTSATTANAGWSVQVGAFGSADAARKLVSDLKKDGLSAYVAPLSRNGKTLHRVRVGPEPTRADADKLAAKLKGRGLPASVVAGA